MRWCFWTQIEDLGRMEARVIQTIDRLQARVVTLSSTRLNGHIFLSGVVEAENVPAVRIESLLWNIHGMVSAKVLADENTIHRAIGVFGILCDVEENPDALQFLAENNARIIMIQPLWLAFEVVGTPQEIESIYQAALAYGIVNVLSSATAHFIYENDR